MIDLNVQIKLIIFSFCFGLLFKFFELKLDKYLHHQNQLYSIINCFTFVMSFALLYFYNIEKLASGIIHPYSLILVVVGYYLYKPIASFIKK